MWTNDRISRRIRAYKHENHRDRTKIMFKHVDLSNINHTDYMHAYRDDLVSISQGGTEKVAKLDQGLGRDKFLRPGFWVR